MSRKVRIDQEECIGCGNCHQTCPDIFEVDEEIEKTRVIKPEGGDENCIEEAMAECPMQCIYWE